MTNELWYYVLIMWYLRLALLSASRSSFSIAASLTRTSDIIVSITLITAEAKQKWSVPCMHEAKGFILRWSCSWLLVIDWFYFRRVHRPPSRSELSSSNEWRQTEEEDETDQQIGRPSVWWTSKSWKIHDRYVTEASSHTHYFFSFLFFFALHTQWFLIIIPYCTVDISTVSYMAVSIIS